MLSNLLFVTESFTLIAGKSERAVLLHLVEAVHAGGGLLGDAPDARRHPRPAPRLARCSRRSTSRITPHSSGSVSGSKSGTLPARSNSAPLCTSSVASPPSSTIRFGPEPSGQTSASSVHHQYSSSVSPFHAKTGDALRILGRAVGADRDRGGGLVLRGEDVARHPAHVGAELVSVSISTAVCTVMCRQPMIFAPASGLLAAIARAQRHQAGHLLLGEPDLLAAALGEIEVLDLEARAGLVDTSGAPLTRPRMRTAPSVYADAVLQSLTRSSRGWARAAPRGDQCSAWGSRSSKRSISASKREPSSRTI